MKIAPIDVAHKTFTRKFSGLSKNEVYQYLRDVADVMEEMVREKNALSEKVRQKDEQIKEYKEKSESLQETLHTLNKVSEQMRHDAEREGMLIVEDARQQGDAIVRGTKESLRKTYQEIAHIKTLKMQFESNMKALLKAHESMLSQSGSMLNHPVFEKIEQQQLERQKNGEFNGDFIEPIPGYNKKNPVNFDTPPNGSEGSNNL